MTLWRHLGQATRRAMTEQPWPVQVTPSPPDLLDEQQLGIVAVTLALRFPEWVLRRVEQVSYIDDTTVRWRISVTFRWPDSDMFPEEARPDEGQQMFVPLARHAKGPLTQLDVMNDSGDRLMVPPTELNGRLASSGLVATIWSLAIEERTGKAPSDRVVDAIEAIAMSPPELARRILRDELNGELGAILNEPDEYRALLAELADNFLLLVPVDYHAGGVGLVKYAYSSPLPWALSLRNVASRFGWADNEVSLLRLPLGFAQSYHIDVAAPEDVEIAKAELAGHYVVDKEGRGPGVPEGGVDRTFTGVTLSLDDDGGNPHVNLHAARPARPRLVAAAAGNPDPRLDPADAPLEGAAEHRPTVTQRADVGFAIVRFRSSADGVFLALLLTSVLNVALLFWAKRTLSTLDGQIAAAILLAVPALVVGYLVRQGEHRFATRLLSGVRIAALVTAVCALTVAALVAQGLIIKRDPAPLRYTCQATNALLGTGARRTSQLDSLNCRAVASTRRTSVQPKLKRNVKGIVSVLTAVAVASTSVIGIGWVRTSLAPVTRRREPAEDDLSDVLLRAAVRSSPSA